MTVNRPQPTKEWLDACRDDNSLAVDAIYSWADLSYEWFLEWGDGKRPDVPYEYRRLTDAIVMWCDAVIKGIDPTPLLDYASQVEVCSPPRVIPGWDGLDWFYETWKPKELCDSEFNKTMSLLAAARTTYLRLLNATLALSGDNPPPQSDGPDRESVGVFWWRGQRYAIGKQSWRLVSACWATNADGISFEDLRDEVFGIETPPTTIRSAVHRLNQEMEANGISVLWSTENEYVKCETNL